MGDANVRRPVATRFEHGVDFGLLEVEVAQLRVEVEGQRRRGDDLGQRLGVAEAQVRSLTSTLCASFGA